MAVSHGVGACEMSEMDRRRSWIGCRWRHMCNGNYWSFLPGRETGSSSCLERAIARCIPQAAAAAATRFRLPSPARYSRGCPDLGRLGVLLLFCEFNGSFCRLMLAYLEGEGAVRNQRAAIVCQIRLLGKLG